MPDKEPAEIDGRRTKNSSSSPKFVSTRLDLISDVSKRLFIALLFIISFFIFGAWMFFEGALEAGGTILTMFTWGAIGAFVSLQRRLKVLDIDDLLLLKSTWIYVFLSPLVGGILATLMLILFSTGMFQGDMFPHLAFRETERMIGAPTMLFVIEPVDFKDLGKAMFWSFVAGYSEKFVTDIVGSFDKAARTQFPNESETDNQNRLDK